MVDLVTKKHNSKVIFTEDMVARYCVLFHLVFVVR